MTTPAPGPVLASYTDLPWPRTLSVTSTTAGKTLTSTAGLLIAYTARETSGSAAADFQVYDGTSATGQLLATVGLVAGSSFGLAPGLPGVPFRGGLFVAAGTGAWEAAFTYIPMTGGL